MFGRVLKLIGCCATLLAGQASALAAAESRSCWPGFTIPAVTIPAVTIPAVTIPAVTVPAVTIPRTCFAGHCYPARHYPAHHYPAKHYPAKHYPARHLPARHIPGHCFATSSGMPSPRQTTVRVARYEAIDPSYSADLSQAYWGRAGRTSAYPNVFARGFGELNGAGFPRNQYVRTYIRRDGRVVLGYWRNSPHDGLPTCRIIKC